MRAVFQVGPGSGCFMLDPEKSILSGPGDPEPGPGDPEPGPGDPKPGPVEPEPGSG